MFNFYSKKLLPKTRWKLDVPRIFYGEKQILPFLGGYRFDVYDVI